MAFRQTFDMDLLNEKNELDKKLSTSVRLMQDYGLKLAEAEHDYKVELAKTALELKEKGTAVTMLPLVIYGTGAVPKLRLQRDTAEVMYKTAQENIQAMKLRLRLVEAQIEREWGQAGGV